MKDIKIKCWLVLVLLITLYSSKLETRVEVIPSYSDKNQQQLKRLFIIMTMNQNLMEDLFNIYYIHVFNPVTGTSFYSILDLLSCEDRNGCSMIEIPSSFCSQSSIINVTIETVNVLRAGPQCHSFAIIECANNFVEMVYKDISELSDLESVNISCVFLNRSNTSEKICYIAHQLCDRSRATSLKLNNQVHKKDPLYNIELDISNHLGQLYCSTTTAGNDSTYSVKVEGSFDFITGLDRGNSNHTIITATVTLLPIFSVFVGITVIVIIVLIILSRRRTSYQLANNIEMQDLTPYNLPTSLRVHKIGADCKLRQYVTKTLGVEFKRGHTYYEFTNGVENILGGKEVLLQDIKGKHTKWFRLHPPEEVTAVKYGKGISRDYFGENYNLKVFIQSFGSGARHLPHGSRILYNHSEDQVEPDALPLVPVCSEHFAHKIIDSEEGLPFQQFCTQNGLSQKAFNMFLTVEHLPERMRDQPPRDIILMNRESMELFTGPYARQMLDPRNGGEVQPDNEKWNVFVLLEKNKQGLVLQKNSEVLYQDSRYMNGQYSVLEADKDHVRMSKFIEAKLACRYEDGKAFYEAEKEEDLLYCKKILRPQKEELSCEQVELQSFVEYFYAIDGVPAKGIKLDDLHHSKVFIQSTSQGSRCLRKGDKLLYLQKYISDNHKLQDSDLGDKHYLCEQK